MKYSVINMFSTGWKYLLTYLSTFLPLLAGFCELTQVARLNDFSLFPVLKSKREKIPGFSCLGQGFGRQDSVFGKKLTFSVSKKRSIAT
jgi:hypothetical protein